MIAAVIRIKQISRLLDKYLAIMGLYGLMGLTIR